MVVLLPSAERLFEITVPNNFNINYLCNPVSLIFRKIIIAIMSKVPPMEIKRKMFCWMGYNFEKDVCLPGYIDISPCFPKLISLDEGVLVGGMTTINTASLQKNKLLIGKVHVKRRVLLGGLTTLNPGAVINENCLTGMNSIVDIEIPKNSFVIKYNKVLATWSKKQLDKYFHISKQNPKFGEKVRKITRKFRKDKSLRKVEFQHDGNRLNAGCDWWRARPVTRIYYNGLFVELALICPFEFGRKLLYWCMGQNLFGKNIKLGKKVLFDHIYGDFQKIGKNVIFEEGALIDGHEYTTSETVYAKSIIEDNVVIKKGAYVRAGLTIGRNAILEKDSFAMKDIGPGEIWKGAPAKLVGHINPKKDKKIKKKIAEKNKR